jgi:hypothetical protein
MFSWVGVAVTLLASPSQAIVGSDLPKEVLPLELTLVHRTVSPSRDRGTEPAPATEAQTEAQMWSWLAQLAVVRAQPRLRRGPPSVQMFLVVAPVSGAVGLWAFGSF